ncbi:MAG: HAMP domain-containing histidine kinase [Pseudomonadales bacterium]|nr:HAMP domain-containing histidine kinase [Pseudomonadales bacterium]
MSPKHSQRKADTETVVRFSFQAAMLDARTSTLFRVYSFYRIVSAISLLLLGLGIQDDALVGGLYPTLYLYGSAIYVAITLVSGSLFFSAAETIRWTRIYAVILIDIVAISLLLHASDGVASGLGILLIVNLAAGNILITGQMGLLLPAVASISVLGNEAYLSLASDSTSQRLYFQAGLLGVIYFAVSWSMQYLTHRIRSSTELADQRAQDLTELQQLNELIIQRMLTGIMVLTGNDEVRMMNRSARNLIHAVTSDDAGLTPEHMYSAPIPELSKRLEHWRSQPNQRPELFKVDGSGPEIQVNFAALGHRNTDETLVFLEDHSQIAQRAQHLKLASLGNLTASIAHEIRNPLGAISHAAQLLLESPDLSDADRRLVDIAQNHSLRANAIIENILQLSLGKPSVPEQIELSSWLQNFIATYSENHPQTKVRLLNKGQQRKARFDQGQLMQVFTNLFDNGIRHSKQNTGNSTLDVMIGDNSDQDLPFVLVQDQGHGVDPDQREKLFEPFYTTDRSGTGLGLYISRELAQANQAQLDLVESESYGACFKVTFSHPQRLTQ